MTEKLRWTRAIAVLAVLAAVVGALVVVTNRVTQARAAGDRAAQPRSSTLVTVIRVPDPDPYAPVLGPVALGGVQKLSGGPGFLVQLQALRGNDAGTLSFTVHLRNLGLNPVDGALKTGVWLATDDGALIGPKAVLSSASPAGSASRADRVLVFPAPDPEQGRPTQLRITLHLGTYYPTAAWTLTS